MSRFGRAVMLCVGISVVAPSATAAQEVRGGVVGGIAFSNLSNLTEAIDFGVPVDVERRTGVVFGPFIRVRFKDWFAVQPEVLFVTRGATATDGTNEVRIKLSYIDIPVLARFSPAPGSGFYVLAGPSLNFNVSAKTIEVFPADDVVPTETEEDIGDLVKSTDVAVVLGAGVDIRRLFVEGRYAAGLRNIADGPMFNASIRNRTVMVLTGIRF